MKSSEQGSSLFLIQPSVHAPPPPAIPRNTGWFLFYTAFGNIRGYSPYIPTSRSRLNPTCTSTNSFYQKGPVHFKTAGELQLQADGTAAGIQYRQSCKVAPCSASSQVWAQQTRLRLCLCAAAWFSRLCWATFVMVTGPRWEKKLSCTEDSKGMPASIIIILQPREHAW